MILAVLGDVRGNFAALSTVLGEIDDSGIQTILHCASSCGDIGDSGSVLDLLRERNVATVQGERDRLVVKAVRKSGTLESRLTAEAFAAIRSTHDSLGPGRIEFLRGLPGSRALEVDGIHIVLCHGTPSSQSETLGPDTDTLRFRRIREEANADIVVFGRNKTPFWKRVEGTLFVTPGSLEAREGTARYAVVSTEDEPWSVEFREVAF